MALHYAKHTEQNRELSFLQHVCHSVCTIIGCIDTHSFPWGLLRVEENTNQYNGVTHLGVQLAQLPLCWTLNLPVLTVELHLHGSDKYQIIPI